MLALASLLVAAGLVFTPCRRRGSRSGRRLYFLEVLIYANVPAFLWLGYYGWRVSRSVRAADALPDAD